MNARHKPLKGQPKAQHRTPRPLQYCADRRLSNWRIHIVWRNTVRIPIVGINPVPLIAGAFIHSPARQNLMFTNSPRVQERPPKPPTMCLQCSHRRLRARKYRMAQIHTDFRANIFKTVRIVGECPPRPYRYQLWHDSVNGNPNSSMCTSRSIKRFWREATASPFPPTCIISLPIADQRSSICPL